MLPEEDVMTVMGPSPGGPLNPRSTEYTHPWTVATSQSIPKNPVHAHWYRWSVATTTDIVVTAATNDTTSYFDTALMNSRRDDE